VTSGWNITSKRRGWASLNLLGGLCECSDRGEESKIGDRAFYGNTRQAESNDFDLSGSKRDGLSGDLNFVCEQISPIERESGHR